jgi:ketosteroid isomerase-like protein
MYHAIVRRIAKRNFERVNQHDFEALLKDCSPEIHHRFGGRHALGGERHDKEALRLWFGRLGRLAPDLKLTVRDVWVNGWPHDTVVVIRWTATDRYPDGAPYDNHGVHVVRMRWGKVWEIDANEDSQVVADILRARFEAGIEEAGAPAIES